MLASGKEKLERMRDGRIVYVGAERVNDVTTHPAFRNGAHFGQELDTGFGEEAGEPFAASRSMTCVPALFCMSIRREFGFEKLSLGQDACGDIVHVSSAPVPCCATRSKTTSCPSGE